MGKWYEECLRRNVIDMHIADWSPEFMSRFDAKEYVTMLRLARAQSAVVYAHSHVGHTYFPTAVGHMHEGLQGRDILSEVLAECKSEGIHTVVYFSVIHDRYAYVHHPSFRVIKADGREATPQGRHGICCPNSPYRDYVAALVAEMAEGRDFDGVRFDMTFWTHVCYCPHCRARYDMEIGGDIPQTIDWGDPVWTGFQRKREEWLVDFAGHLTRAAKLHKANATVEHQSSTFSHYWGVGVTHELAAQSDFLQGDFYGDAVQGSFARKLFLNLSQNLPYGFETSFSVDLANHTASKSEELLRCKASAALADQGAFVFIDAISPDGTLHRPVYERMAKVFSDTSAYEPFLGGVPCHDVAVYLSTESKFDPSDNGKSVTGPVSNRAPHVDAVLSCCRTFMEGHIPFGVITKRNIGQLDGHRVLVLPNVLMMDEEEVSAIRRFVLEGGSVYASGYTSLTTKDGRRRPDFMLGDVFGVTYAGETSEQFTYMRPSAEGESLFHDYDRDWPLGIPGRQVTVHPHTGSVTLATLTLPYADPCDPTAYSSIHSDPPGRNLDDPSLVLNSAGKGLCCYATTDIEASDPYRETFASIVRMLARGSLSFQATAPKAVEVTLFRQVTDSGEDRFLVSFVNFQKDLPNILVSGIRATIHTGAASAWRVRLLPGGDELEGTVDGLGGVSFTLPTLETLHMVVIDRHPR